MDPSVFVTLGNRKSHSPKIKGVFIPILVVVVAAELYFAWKSLPLMGYYNTVKCFLLIIAITCFVVVRIEKMFCVRKLKKLLENAGK